MPVHHKLGRCERRFTAILLLSSAGAALLGGAGLLAQEGPPPAAPLAVKQDMIRDRLDRFRDRVFRLQQELSEQEPENAQRLARALNRLGEIGATDKLAELVERLGKGENLHETLGLQEQTVADLEVVLGVLLQRDSQNEERKEEIDRLKERLKQLSELLDRQRDLRDQTAQQKQAAELAEQLEQAQALLAEQEQLSKDTAKNAEGSSPPSPLEAQKQAQRQGELAERVKALEAKVREAAAYAAAPSAPQDAASSDAVPPDATPPNATPPSGTSPSASPPDGTTPDAGSRKPQPLSAKPTEGATQQDGEGKPSPSGKEAGEQQKAEQAAESLQEAAEKMSEAREALEEAQPESAKEAQEQAEEQLRRAIHALEEAQKTPPKEESAELGRQQRALAEEAGNLSSDSNPPQPGGQPQEQDSPKSGDSKPSPPSDNVQRAEREMWDAAEKLERKEQDQAVEKQDKAIDALKDAKRELEEALQQKRREEREEMLRDLEARFHDLAVKQKRLNDETISLDGVGAASFARAEQLRAAELADTQGKLAAAVDTCLHILEEEGTTVVFPRILEQVAVDMRLVAERLIAYQTGALTQSMQKEVLEALEQLLDSVRRMQQENQKQDEPQPSASPTDQTSPLLPTSAELKLLRSSQARVHERTEAIEKAKTLETGADEVLSKTIEATAQRQKDCAEIARQLRERTEQE